MQWPGDDQYRIDEQRRQCLRQEAEQHTLAGLAQGERRAIGNTRSLKRPGYLIVVFIVLLGLSVAIACVVTFAHGTPPQPTPFAEFADVFPGQPKSAVLARGFSCALDGESGMEYCVLRPKLGAFPRIAVVINTDIVVEIAFTLPEGALRLGDLIMLWGKPEVQGEVWRMNLFSWRNHSIVATSTHSRQLGFTLPIEIVLFKTAFTDSY